MSLLTTRRAPTSDGPTREHDALFAPDGQALAQRLLTARQLHFGFSPHNAAPVTATFEVDGLAKHLEPIAKRCGR